MGHSHLSRLALRRGLRSLAIAASLVALANGASVARPLDKVKEAGVLRVAVYQDYKPYSWSQDGNARGVDVEIAEALAKSLGVKLDLFELRADDNIEDDLRNGVWRGSLVGAAPGDVMIHVPYDKAIEKGNNRVSLLAPYHIDGMAMAVDPAKAEQAKDLSLFEKEKVSVAYGTMADMILISAEDHKYLPNVAHFKGLDAAVGAFERGETPAVYGEASALQAAVKKGARPYTLVYPKTKPSPDWMLGMAVKADSKDLGAVVTATVDQMIASGEIARIFAKYDVEWRKPEAAR